MVLMKIDYGKDAGKDPKIDQSDHFNGVLIKAC